MAGNSKLSIEEIDRALRSVTHSCDGQRGRGCPGRAGRQALTQRLLALIDKLDDRGKTVITQRYGLDGESPKTLQAIGNQFNRTRERIRQIQNIGLARLQELLQES